MLEHALLSTGLLIVVAKLAEGILQRFRLNSIVAYTATGILLGPVTGIVEINSYLQILLSIGIFFISSSSVWTSLTSQRSCRRSIAGSSSRRSFRW